MIGHIYFNTVLKKTNSPKYKSLSVTVNTACTQILFVFKKRWSCYYIDKKVQKLHKGCPVEEDKNS